jgi:tetratricopeptide (TPR) repeat protein
MSDRAAYQKSLQELLRLSQKIPDSEAKATLLAKLRFANAIALSQIKEPDFTILEQAELLKQLSNSQYSTTTDCLAQFGFLLERITPAFESKPGSDKILVGQALLEYVMRIHKYTKSSRNSLDNFQILLENGGEYSLSKQIWEQRIKHASQNGEKDLVTLEVDSLRSLVKCDRPQAEELINKILHDKNSDFIAIARCWYLLADSAYKAGHYQDAKNYCDKALKTGPILTDNDEQFELLELKYLALYQLKDDARISELSKMLVDLLIAFIERNGPTVIIKSKGQAVSIREARANGEQSRCVIAIKLLSQAKQYAQLRRLLTAVQVQIESNDWPSFTKLFKKVMHETTPCEDSSCSALAKKILAEIASRETISSTNSRERNSSTKR